MAALEMVMAAIQDKGIDSAYAIVRELGGEWLQCEHKRLVRAAAYQVIENNLGTDAMDALMDEVSPGWRD